MWWNRLKGTVASWATYVWMKYRLCEWFSKAYRYVFERSYRSVEIPTFYNFNEMAHAIQQFTWEKDGFRRLWDTHSYPGRIVATGRDDCDGFACFIIHALDDSIKSGKWNDRIVFNEKMLTITWQNKDGSLGGHNVALLYAFKSDSAPDEKALSYGWMDYRYPVFGFETEDAVINSVMSMHSPGGKVLTYGLMGRDWKYEKVVRVY